MTTWQQIIRVEVPIALPLILVGLRTSAIFVVATATIAAYIGLGGLGRFIIDGLASNQYGPVAGGALLVVILAIARARPVRRHFPAGRPGRPAQAGQRPRVNRAPSRKETI